MGADQHYNVPNVAQELLFEQRRGAVETAERYLNSLINLRKHKPGERLPTASELSKQCGVSRPAVLQAMQILQSQGRIRVKPGRGGVWIRESLDDNLDARIARAWENRETILEMSELRSILEPGAAQLCATRGVTPQHLNQMKALIDEMAVTSFTNFDHYRGLDNEFHVLIGRATGLKIVEQMVTMCRTEVAIGFDAMEVPTSRKQSSDEEHLDIYDAITKRDGRRAHVITFKHIALTTTLLREVLEGPSMPTGKRARTAREAMSSTQRRHNGQTSN